MKTSSFTKGLLSILLFLLFLIPLQAQERTGTIYGKVTDESRGIHQAEGRQAWKAEQTVRLAAMEVIAATEREE